MQAHAPIIIAITTSVSCSFALPSGLLYFIKQATWFKQEPQEPQQQHTKPLLVVSSAFLKRCANITCEEGCSLGLEPVPEEIW
jgi:hypothetical protein